MLTIPRALARSFRGVLRRCLSGPGTRPQPPLVLARCDGQSLTLQAAGPDVAVLPPGPDVLRLASSESSATPAAPPPTQRRRTAMPAQPGNGHPRPEDRPAAGAAERPGGLEDLIAEAVTLRNLLADAATRAARLVAALKQQRRQSKAVENALVSLRQLNLGG